jgi:prolyl-tRNA editing enzyme YbaK/EbsC (Cys-tRNA(Pro) deacylase)
MTAPAGHPDPVEARVLDAVAAAGHPFEVIACEPDLADTAEFCAHYGYALEESANTIVVASRRPEGHFAACVVLATTRLDVNGTVRRRLGVRKVSFAAPEATADVTGMVMGGVTPFGLPPGLACWVDSAVMHLERVIVGGGSRRLKLYVAPAALVAEGAEVVEGLAIPEAGGPRGAEPAGES